MPFSFRYTSKENRHKDRLKDDRMFDIQMRNRAFHYIDPWRRFVNFLLLIKKNVNILNANLLIIFCH